MIRFYKYLIGFLCIKIEGEETEKLLNVCAFKRIRIWDLKYKNRTITGKIGIKDLKKLRLVKRGIKANFHITKKSGLPFRTKNVKNRLGLIIGLFVFLALLKFLSSFVWGIQVSGNVKLKESKVLAVCENLGIKEGIKKSELDTAVLEQQIPLNINGISWCSVNIEGCYVTVNISESKKEKKENLPSNLKATADGIIEKIDVTSGETLVKIGDTVAKGDILVSGVTTIGSSTVFAASKGTIIAKTTRTIEKSDSLYSTKLVNYKRKNKSVINVFSLNIPLYLGKESMPYTSKTKVANLKLFNKVLPIGITTKTFMLKKEKKIILSEKSLKNKLNKEIEKDIEKLNISSYEPITEEIIKTKNVLTVKKTISTTENIAKEEIINIDKK